MSARVLSIHYNRNKLGAACYDQEAATVFLLNDLVEDEDDFRMVHSCKLQASIHSFQILSMLSIGVFGEFNSIFKCASVLIVLEW